jgi:hypothetical protein
MNIQTLAQLSTQELAILNGWHDDQAMTGNEIDQMVEQFQKEDK